MNENKWISTIIAGCLAITTVIHSLPQSHEREDFDRINDKYDPNVPGYTEPVTDKIPFSTEESSSTTISTTKQGTSEGTSTTSTTTNGASTTMSTTKGTSTTPPTTITLFQVECHVHKKGKVHCKIVNNKDSSEKDSKESHESKEKNKKCKGKKKKHCKKNRGPKENRSKEKKKKKGHRINLFLPFDF
ncbi:ELMO domain-containing protein C-like [Limulus polyphemus]|uniref:ELMO domain-containing protein C-like n=1 Tax=Limulus polyphemus TaxID=6850 RepID=A0ABM1BTZ4_LIMPO|nr:ELMO domain-containing protein C-like [Limulus polyphemus]